MPVTSTLPDLRQRGRACTPQDLKQLDEQLSRGNVPADLLERLALAPNTIGAGDLLMAKGPAGLFLVDDGKDATARSKTLYRFHFQADLIHNCVIGAAIGGILFNSPWAALLGLAIGGAKVWSAHTKDKSGIVTTELDGRRSQHTYRMHPRTYVKDAAEIRARLLAAGTLGDHVDACPPRAPAPAAPLEPKLLAQLESRREELLSLQRARRLLADFGERSRYGEPALHSISALDAQQLLASKKPIYVLSADPPKDETHHLKVTGQSNRGEHLTEDQVAYSLRTVRYQLQRVDAPADLDAAKKNCGGLPEGFMGVLRDKASFSELVSATDRAWGDLMQGSTHRTWSWWGLFQRQ